MENIEYIRKVNDTWICDHPVIEKFWMWGGFAVGSTSNCTVSLLYHVGEREVREEFHVDDISNKQWAVDAANAYLNKLIET